MAMLVLDTCLPACTAVLVRDGVVLAARREPMGRGHQERLATMVAEVMQEAGASFADLTRVAATVGPGSFTGLRVGLSFARGLSAALTIPCAGIGTLEALAHGLPGFVVAAIDARRGQLYWQAFEDGAALTPPQASAAADVAAFCAGRAPPLIAGSGGSILVPLVPGAHPGGEEAPTVLALAALAARQPPMAPDPVYLRAPDAKLPGGLTP